jgi:FtsP/CotA-like multicopper oxidase with cupredoxin domain
MEAAAKPRLFEVPLRIPPVLKPARKTADADYYVTVMRRARVQILPRKLTTAWTFDGSFPGPTIKVRRGRTAVVRRINRLNVPTTTHLHGARVRPGSDGQPLDLTDPGGRKDYIYPNEQDATTLWYHDHTHHHSSRNNYMGLMGLYIIEDEEEEELNLPRGKYDIPLILQDRSFKRDGSFRFHDHHDEVLGQTILVNGRPTPYLKVANRKYRFRILNASHTRGYELALDSGAPLIQIGSDQGLLPAPHAAGSIPLWPAERADVVIDFSAYPVGTSVVLEHRDPDDPTNTRRIMRFDVAREEADTSSLPVVPRPIARITSWAREREFDLSFDHDNRRWEINGRPFDPQRIDIRPKQGSTELWTFRNLSSVAHPMHVHLVRFQIVSRSNLAVSPGELGWKDTVRVDPSRNVSVAMTFEKFTGRYMYHCHNLAHENHSMMGQMKIVP